MTASVFEAGTATVPKWKRYDIKLIPLFYYWEVKIYLASEGEVMTKQNPN
jgi:hypothetical protein